MKKLENLTTMFLGEEKVQNDLTTIRKKSLGRRNGRLELQVLSDELTEQTILQHCILYKLYKK